MRWVLLLLFVVGCSPAPEASKREKERISDEYVLVEFAAKLEEDYQRNGGVVVK